MAVGNRALLAVLGRARVLALPGVPRRVAPRRLRGPRRGGGAGRGGAAVGAAGGHPGARVHGRVPEPLRVELGAGEPVARRAGGGLAAPRRPGVRLPHAGGARRRHGGGVREDVRRAGQGVGAREGRRGDGARRRGEGAGHAAEGGGAEGVGARGCKCQSRRRGEGLVRARHGAPPRWCLRLTMANSRSEHLLFLLSNCSDFPF